MFPTVDKYGVLAFGAMDEDHDQTMIISRILPYLAMRLAFPHAAVNLLCPSELAIRSCYCWKKFTAASHRRLLPPPLFPGTATIQHIVTVGELKAEGCVMRSCVASLRSQALTGECVLYRVLAPQRATLELRRNKDGILQIGQLKLAKNRPPAAESWNIVRQWFVQCLDQRKGR